MQHWRAQGRLPVDTDGAPALRGAEAGLRAWSLQGGFLPGVTVDLFTWLSVRPGSLDTRPSPRTIAEMPVVFTGPFPCALAADSPQRVHSQKPATPGAWVIARARPSEPGGAWAGVWLEGPRLCGNGGPVPSLSRAPECFPEGLGWGQSDRASRRV